MYATATVCILVSTLEEIFSGDWVEASINGVGDEAIQRHCRCLVVASLERQHQIAGVKLAVAVPITFFIRRVVRDSVFVFARLKHRHQIRRIEQAVAIGVANNGSWRIDFAQVQNDRYKAAYTMRGS